MQSNGPANASRSSSAFPSANSERNLKHTNIGSLAPERMQRSLQNDDLAGMKPNQINSIKQSPSQLSNANQIKRFPMNNKPPKDRSSLVAKSAPSKSISKPTSTNAPSTNFK